MVQNLSLNDHPLRRIFLFLFRLKKTSSTIEKEPKNAHHLLMKVILAEKPSVAKDIANFLGAKERKDGYFEGNGYRVTWAFGHIVTLKEPGEYDPALKK